MSHKNFAHPLNILKQGNSKSIDRNFFIPLFHHLNKSYLDESEIIKKISTLVIPNDIQRMNHMINQIGKIWEEFIQTGIRKFVMVNPYLKYFNMHKDQKKFLAMPNGSLLVRENNKLVAEFDNVLLYHNQHPIIVEIKSSTHKGSGTSFGSGHYQVKMKIARRIFSDYAEPFFLKIRASEDNHDVGLVSQYRDHRKIAMNHSPMLTDLKHMLGRSRFK